MAYFMGIDIGSVTTKAVIVKDGEPVVHHVIPSGANYRIAAQRGSEEVLAAIPQRYRLHYSHWLWGKQR